MLSGSALSLSAGRTPRPLSASALAFVFTAPRHGRVFNVDRKCDCPDLTANAFSCCAAQAALSRVFARDSTSASMQAFPTSSGIVGSFGCDFGDFGCSSAQASAAALPWAEESRRACRRRTGRTEPDAPAAPGKAGFRPAGPSSPCPEGWRCPVLRSPCRSCWSGSPRRIAPSVCPAALCTR